jgi:hypothetical protein
MAGVPLAPLYLFQAETQIATGAVVAKDAIVESRQITVGRR